MKFIILRPIFQIFIEFFRYQLGLKVLSGIVAITLWVVVFGSRTIEITKDVPFEVIVGEDQILVDPVPEKISFRMSGPKAFLRSITNRIEDPIRANVKELKTGVFTHRVFSDSIKLPLGVKVQSINPNVVQLRVEELKRKFVPVKLITSNELPAQVKLTKVDLLPPQIKIKGPKNRVMNLTSIPTIPIDLSAIRETTSMPLAFDFKTMGIDPDSVLPEVSIEVQAKGQAFRVKHVPIQIKSTGRAKSDDEEVTVIVRTDPNDSVKVDGDKISAYIDVRDMPEGEFLKLIKVQLPERVHLVRVLPLSTRVIVKGQ